MLNPVREVSDFAGGLGRGVTYPYHLLRSRSFDAADDAVYQDIIQLTNGSRKFVLTTENFSNYLGKAMGQILSLGLTLVVPGLATFFAAEYLMYVLK